MPRKDVILNLPGFSIKKATGFNPILFDVVYRRVPRCPHCDSKRLRKKDTFMRTVRHVAMGLGTTLLSFKAHKFYCRDCHRYFNQRFPGIEKAQRATSKLHQQIFHQHTKGICQKDLATDFKLGKATIERWYHREYRRRDSHQQNRNCPQVLGIDEHSFTKKQGFATTFCDLRKHKIFDVVKGRSAKDLEEYLNALPGKEHVKVICIDLSSTYRYLIKRFFPNAKIVADRFHVIRLLHHMGMQTYQQIDPTIKRQRGLLKLLKMKPEKMTDKQLAKRDEYLDKQPAIAAIYQFNQRMHRLLTKKHRTAKQCKRLLPLFLNWVGQLKQSAFKGLATLGNTFYRWREEIVRMWRFTKNNGITEGFHRKMKLIQRRAYGFRNFENYRLRVRVLCS